MALMIFCNSHFWTVCERLGVRIFTVQAGFFAFFDIGSEVK